MRFQVAMGAVVLLATGCVRQSLTQTMGPVPAPGTPAPKTVWERQVQNATDAGDGDYALRVLRERVEGDPANIPARLELVNAYRQRGYRDVALEICRLVVQRFPESSEAQLALVSTLHEVNRRSEAIQVADAYLAGHPNASAEYYSWLGILHDEAGEWTKGEPHHRQALAANPASGAQYALHNNLGYNLLMQKKNADAAAEFREALRLNPGSQVARNNLGLALADGNAAEAISNWKSGSDEAAAHNNLAAVWIEKKDYVQARKELEIALSYNRSLPAALHNLELVSRLDGKPAVIDSKPAESRWERLKTGFIHLWVGSLDDPHNDAEKPQTLSSPGEKQ
jgi:tetratricopeptide (TPR) repeat protein